MAWCVCDCMGILLITHVSTRTENEDWIKEENPGRVGVTVGCHHSITNKLYKPFKNCDWQYSRAQIQLFGLYIKIWVFPYMGNNKQWDFYYYIVLFMMVLLWRRVEEEGGRVVLLDRWEVGRWSPAQGQRDRESQTCFQVTNTCSVFKTGIQPLCKLHLIDPAVLCVPAFSSVGSLFCVSRASLLTNRRCWFSVPQLWWSFSESELELPNREGAVAAASLLRMWRYAWLLQSINISSTKCGSGMEDYYDMTDIIVWRWPLCCRSHNSKR